MSTLKQTFLFFLLPLSLLSLLFLFLIPITTTPSHISFSNPTIPFSPPPKIAYFITGSNLDGPTRIFRLLLSIYHPRNYYLLNLDGFSGDKERDQLANLVGSVPIFVEIGNVNVIKKSNPVNQQGSSVLALVLPGASVLLRWKLDWDWFLNLDASDYPLIPQDVRAYTVSVGLGQFDPTLRSITVKITEIIVDSRIYLQSSGKMFTGDKKRTLPDSFRFLTGSPHVILNRNFVEFFILGWENLPRTLLLYFSNTRFSHKAYFQTLAYNSKKISDTVINSNLRFIDGHQEMPLDFNRMLESGAAFAGNFCVNDPVLDLIDSVLLNKGRGMIAPGAWCLGKTWFGRNSCSRWGNIDILKPGTPAKRFEKLLLKLIGDVTLKSSLYDYQ